MITKEKIEGAVYGLALGDAWGYPYEFQKFSSSPDRSLIPETLVVSDDTQMSIYTIQGIIDALDQMPLEDITTNSQLRDKTRKLIAEHYIKFYFDPDNNRAPGRTCMWAIKKLSTNSFHTGEEFQVLMSKGNGANMRAPWISLLPLRDRDKESLGVVQAEITHGHAMAKYATQLTVRAMNFILAKNIDVYAERPLIQRLLESIENDPHSLVREDFINQLLNMQRLYYNFLSHEDEDMATWFTSGVTADTALINVLAAVDAYGWSDRADIGFKRLVQSSGDSDTMAAIAGAMIGAIQGPEFLRSLIEHRSFEERYMSELNAVVENLHDLNTQKSSEK